MFFWQSDSRGRSCCQQHLLCQEAFVLHRPSLLWPHRRQKRSRTWERGCHCQNRTGEPLKQFSKRAIEWFFFFFWGTLFSRKLYLKNFNINLVCVWSLGRDLALKYNSKSINGWQWMCFLSCVSDRALPLWPGEGGVREVPRGWARLGPRGAQEWRLLELRAASLQHHTCPLQTPFVSLFQVTFMLSKEYLSHFFTIYNYFIFEVKFC